jgi:hypothetical protein
MMDKGTVRNMFHSIIEFEKLVHLVGFIIRKFVTMHGHMNVTLHGHMNVTMHGHMNVTIHGHMNVTMHGHMNVKNKYIKGQFGLGNSSSSCCPV